MNSRGAVAAVLGWLCLTPAPSPAQTLSYVASVKPSQESRGGSEYSPGGRLTATAVTVRTLVRLAGPRPAPRDRSR